MLPAQQRKSTLFISVVHPLYKIHSWGYKNENNIENVSFLIKLVNIENEYKGSVVFVYSTHTLYVCNFIGSCRYSSKSKTYKNRYKDSIPHNVAIVVAIVVCLALSLYLC